MWDHWVLVHFAVLGELGYPSESSVVESGATGNAPAALSTGRCSWYCRTLAAAMLEMESMENLWKFVCSKLCSIHCTLGLQLISWPSCTG